MARKLVQFRGNVEIPEGQEIGLGWTASFKGEGEFTGDSETLKRLEKGEVKITDTLTLTINPDKTTLASIQAPQGPLDEAIVGED